MSIAAQTLPPHTVEVYRWMLQARLLEDKIASLYRAGKIAGGVYLGRGQEAISGAIGSLLQQGKDLYAPLIRDQAGRLAFGEPLIDALRTYLGSAAGPMRGRDGNVHRGRPREGSLAMISHLGAMISTITGGLLAKRLRGKSNFVGATSIGDGGTSTGAFHEGLNLAAVEKLPLILTIVNNQYAYSTPNSQQFACSSLADKAVGYGVHAIRIDGTDLEQCLTAAQEAIARARAGGGPQLIVAEILRLCGHGEHDDASYIDPALRTSELSRDCLHLATEKILSEKWATPRDIEEWKTMIREDINTATTTVLSEPSPHPSLEKWCSYAAPITT